MPTYAYSCSACEHAFDIWQSFSDSALTTCPRCERETLRKVFSPVGVVFKGSGFYRTDSRSKGGSKASGDGGTGSAERAAPSGDGGTGSAGKPADAAASATSGAKESKAAATSGAAASGSSGTAGAGS